MKKLQDRLHSKKGFTLVELIVVIVIIAILAAALVTSLIGYINSAREANAKVEATNAYTASQAYISEAIGKDKNALANNKLTAALLQDAVNKYLGTTDVTAKAGTDNNSISSCVYTTDTGTIVGFTYTSSGGQTVFFDGATGKAGWDATAAHTTVTTSETELIPAS